MPKRYRPPTRRRKKKQSRPNIPVAPVPPSVPEEAVEEEVNKPAQAGPVAGVTAAPQSVRHIARDYSYVVIELRRIVPVIAIIIGGLIVAVALLRWF
ncbi:MAG: hypothetical protein ACE5KW_01465 [Dehalococcoidia bacterium]